MTTMSAPVADHTAPLLSLRGVNKSFGAVDVLRRVDLNVRHGKVTALVGDNGAGQSHPLQGIRGHHTRAAGPSSLHGEPSPVHTPRARKATAACTLGPSGSRHSSGQTGQPQIDASSP